MYSLNYPPQNLQSQHNSYVVNQNQKLFCKPPLPLQNSQWNMSSFDTETVSKVIQANFQTLPSAVANSLLNSPQTNLTLLMEENRNECINLHNRWNECKEHGNKLLMTERNIGKFNELLNVIEDFLSNTSQTIQGQISQIKNQMSYDICALDQTKICQMTLLGQRWIEFKNMISLSNVYFDKEIRNNVNFLLSQEETSLNKFRFELQKIAMEIQSIQVACNEQTNYSDIINYIGIIMQSIKSARSWLNMNSLTTNKKEKWKRGRNSLDVKSLFPNSRSNQLAIEKKRLLSNYYDN